MRGVITIGGEMGEDGGQVLRTSLALSMCRGKAFEIINIRAKKKKTGPSAAASCCGTGC